MTALKAPITTATEFEIYITAFEIFSFYFSKKISFDISCESSAKQTSHMKCQDIFSAI